jgi:hypothetical protein
MGYTDGVEDAELRNRPAPSGVLPLSSLNTTQTGVKDSSWRCGTGIAVIFLFLALSPCFWMACCGSGYQVNHYRTEISQVFGHTPPYGGVKFCRSE